MGFSKGSYYSLGKHAIDFGDNEVDSVFGWHMPWASFVKNLNFYCFLVEGEPEHVIIKF